MELILSRAGMFKTPHNIEEITICLNHRSQLGVGWSRGSNTRCRIPKEISGHKEKLPKADRGVDKRISELLLSATGKLIQVGSGEYPQKLYKEDVSDVVMAVENLNIVSGLIDTHIILSDYMSFFVREPASDH